MQTNAEMRGIKEYLNQLVTFEKSAIQKDNYFHFKELIKIFRNAWHLCECKNLKII